jgi:hypothetical protein
MTGKKQYIVGYILNGRVVVEAKDADTAKEMVRKKLPGVFIDGSEALIITASELKVMKL